MTINVVVEVNRARIVRLRTMDVGCVLLGHIYVVRAKCAWRGQRKKKHTSECVGQDALGEGMKGQHRENDEHA